MAYMTSIVGQFEFVTKNWVNNPTFRRPNTIVEPIIGQLQSVDGSRKRSFNVRVAGRDHRLTATHRWIIPTGGGYFFVPSLSAIRDVLGSESEADPSGSAVPDAEGRGSGWSDG